MQAGSIRLVGPIGDVPVRPDEDLGDGPDSQPGPGLVLRLEAMHGDGGVRDGIHGSGKEQVEAGRAEA